MWLGKKEAKLNSALLFWLLRYGYIASGFDILHASLDWQARLDKDPIQKSHHEEGLEQSKGRRKYVIDSAVKRSKWSYDQAERYLSDSVRFDDPKAEYALEKFAELINKHGIAKAEMPLELRGKDLQQIVTDLFLSKQ